MAFHINDKGEPGKCSATQGKCPYGGEHQHYPSAEVAQKAYELSMAAQVVAAPVKTNPALSPTGTTSDSVRSAPSAKLPDAFARANGRAKELHEQLRNSYSSLSPEERKHLMAERDRARYDANLILTEIEDRGMGYTIPDQGPTLRVATRAQKVLFEEELVGQFSDGKWENLEQKDWENGGQAHWMIWSDAQVILDPSNVGRNFRAGKDNYQINAKDLLDVVGDRMVQSVKDAGVTSYTEARMASDLRDLRKIMKSPRANHEGAEIKAEEAAPVAPRVQVATQAQQTVSSPSAAGKSTFLKNGANHTDKRLIAEAQKGPGSNLPEADIYGVHSGFANPGSREDPYGHMASGGTLILGMADGSRPRALADGSEILSDPGAELGRPYTLYKARSNGVAEVKPDLRVLGYVDSNGNKFGWVPDKKIQFFVVK